MFSLGTLSRVGLLLYILAFGAVSTAPSYAAPVSQEDLAAQKELVQTKLDSLSALQQKDADGVRLRVEALDKRLDDQLTQTGQGVDRLGVYASILGILVTLLLAAFGMVGYFTVARRARDEAQDAAQQWFDKEAQRLKQKIAELEAEAEKAKKSIFQHESDFKIFAEEAKARLSATGLEGKPNAGGDDSQRASDFKVVRDSADLLTKKPEDSYSFDDWDTRAFAAFGDRKLSDAIYFWSKAVEVSNAGAAKVAQALFNKGVVQGQLQQSEAAIKTYDEVLRRFGDASELVLSKLVAQALFNKGVAQGRLQQSEAAINTYDEVLRRFGDATELVLREHVAKALVNKGITQGQLQQSEAEIQTYEELLRRFGDASELTLRECVAKALVYKGVAQNQLHQSEAAIQTLEEVLRRFGDASEMVLREHVAKALVAKGMSQGQLKQSEAAINTYDEVLRRFGDANELALRELVASALNGIGFEKLCKAKQVWSTDQTPAKQMLEAAAKAFEQAIERRAVTNGTYLGNRAYVRYLQGDVTGAEVDFRSALSAKEDGGENIHQATLKDLDIHPIPEDAGMRALVERLWRQWSDGGGAGTP